jgi:signal transduction histidine kinase
MAASSAAIYRFRLGAGSSLTIVAATGLRARSALHQWVPIAPGLADALEVQRTPVVLGGESRSQSESPLTTGLAAFHRRTLRGASGACVYIPMTISDALYGALAILIPADRDLASEDMELAKTLGRQASLAVTNDWLRTQAGERGAATERTRIASDLHDSVTQTLFSASMTAQALPAVFADDIDEGMVGLEQLHQLTQQANADMRALLIELRPAAIHETGLARALSALVAAIGSRGRLPIQLRIQGDLELPDDVEMGLYRIVQESLNNVVRHAEASSAEVVIRSGAAAVRMRITDDGRGFDPGAAESEHYGLAIMRERAAAIGARLRIEPAPKGGTRVSVYWPQSKGQRDRG